MPAPSIDERIATSVAAVGYGPRSSKQSDFQSGLILADLLEACPVVRQRAASGEVVVRLCHHQTVGTDDWVIDIALGTCSGAPVPPPAGESIRQESPTLIQVAIELKSIWTEHGKARKNRLRDFNAFHGHAHRYNPKTIAAAFLVVNAAERFLSPLNLGKTARAEITEHVRKTKTASALATETIDKFRSIYLRNSHSDPPGLEALGVAVIEHDNIVIHPTPEAFANVRKPTRAAPAPPALRVGDPLHYQTMIQRICAQYTDRFR